MVYVFSKSSSGIQEKKVKKNKNERRFEIEGFFSTSFISTSYLYANHFFRNLIYNNMIIKINFELLLDAW